MNLSPARADVMAELLNVGLGHAAGTLNEMIGVPIRLEVPSVELLAPSEIMEAYADEIGKRAASIAIGFSGGLEGSAALLFPAESAGALIEALSAGGKAADEEEELDILGELGNVVLNSVMGGMANELQHHLVFSVPVAGFQSVAALVEGDTSDPNNRLLFARAGFTVSGLTVWGCIALLLQIQSVETLLVRLDELVEE